MKRLAPFLLGRLILLYGSLASADLTIEITKGSDEAIPIAVVPFSGQQSKQLPEDIAQIVSDDLTHSGQFDPLSRSTLIASPTASDEVRYRDWRAVDSNYLVVGQVSQTGDGYRIQFELMDIYGEKRMLGEAVNVSASQLRSGAHYISDKVYEAITGVRGAFSTRIAYAVSYTHLTLPTIYSV